MLTKWALACSLPIAVMSEKTIHILCSNVRGIICHWSIIKSINWKKYDIVAFNEVWQIKEFENLILEGFKLRVVKLRGAGRGGGTLIFVREGLDVKILDTPFLEGTLETTGISIGELSFINIYRPPSGDRDLFLTSLSQFLDTIKYRKLILGGDFNLNIIGGNDWLQNICSNYELETKINEPTRPESNTCIDNFITNCIGRFTTTNIMIADHLAIEAELVINNLAKKQKEVHQYRVMKEANWQVFNHKLYNLTLQGDSIENKWTNLIDSLKNIVEESFPLKQSSKKYYFTMSQGLMKSRDRKNRLLRQYKQGIIDKSVYIRYNSVYRKLVKHEQAKNFKDQLQNAGSNGKAKWKAIRQGLLLQSSNEKITKISSNGSDFTTDPEIAKAFKTHFETCASNLARDLPEGRDTAVIMPQGDEWEFKTVTIADVIKIIRSLKNKNSSGPDSLIEC
jgi:hypothetical protein